MLFGYVRPSAIDRADESVAILVAAGVEPGNIAVESPSSDVAVLPALSSLIDGMGEGDVIVVTELSQLARSADGLISVLLRIYGAGLHVASVDDHLDTRFIGGSGLFDAVTVLDRARRRGARERQAESMERARGERRRVWGHDPVDPESLERAIGLYMARSATVDEIVSLTGVSKSTLYREIARRGLKRD